MAAWPATLPKPRASGYAITPVDQTIRTSMESGADRTRRRTSARNDKVKLSWQLSDAQMAIFKTWFYDPIATGVAGGSAWFNISLPMGNGGLTTVEAKFVGPYQSSYLEGYNWVVSGEVEIR